MGRPKKNGTETRTERDENPAYQLALVASKAAARLNHKVERFAASELATMTQEIAQASSLFAPNVTRASLVDAVAGAVTAWLAEQGGSMVIPSGDFRRVVGLIRAVATVLEATPDDAAPSVQLEIEGAGSPRPATAESEEP